MRFLVIVGICLISLTSWSQEAMYDICPLKISEEVPNAEVTEYSGESVDLKEFIGKKKTVLIFFRGGWCPYCTRHLAALSDAHQEIEDNGYELIAITPDNVSNLDSALVRGGEFEFTILSDHKANAINAFGLGWHVNDELYTKYKKSYEIDLEWWSNSDHHLLPVPAVYIIEEGVVKYQYVNPKYSQRLDPELIIKLTDS